MRRTRYDEDHEAFRSTARTFMAKGGDRGRSRTTEITKEIVGRSLGV